ncbi:hypothetical protein Adjutor_48 [Mycobacterium phage Adjutor]|nr:hypothetical protein Adjutor_48 [Mycobacterium phage Adjutor]
MTTGSRQPTRSAPKLPTIWTTTSGGWRTMVMSDQTLKLASELNEAVIAFRDGYVYGKSLTRALDKAILMANAADRLNGHLLEVINDQQ